GRCLGLAAEESILELAILAAKVDDFLFPLGDPLLGRGVLTAPVTGLLTQFEVLSSQVRDFDTQLRHFLTQLCEPGWPGGQSVNFLQGLEYEGFHDPGDLRKTGEGREGPTAQSGEEKRDEQSFTLRERLMSSMRWSGRWERFPRVSWVTVLPLRRERRSRWVT